MKTNYKHTQYGALMFVVLIWTGILITVVAIAIINEGRLGAALIMIGIYLLGIALFYAFSVEISAGKLKFWFGIGWIGKTYSLDEIQSVKAVVSPWYYFWGIKSIPGGWLYAIAPGEAVEIILTDGKLVRIGTNQSAILCQAIETAMDAFQFEGDV